jgi:hypothetical protein
MGNDLAAPTAEALAEERGRREAAEDRARQMEAFARDMANRPVAPPAPPVDPGPDPLAVFSKEAAGLTPEAATDLLDKGIQARINRTIAAVVPRLRSEVGQFVNAKGTEDALATVLATNPDIAEDQEGFAAASARVQFALGQKGRTVSPAEFLRLATNKYREGKKQPPTPVDHVEDGSRGAEARPVKAEKPEEPQFSPQAEQIAGWYGLDPAEVMSFDKEGMATLEKMSRDWPDEKNAALEEKDVFSKVPQIELPRRQGRRAKAKAKSAAAAAGG